MDLDKSTYDPKDYESRLYDFWLENGFFNADRNSDKKPYTILMPPPNVTSPLHMGHGAGYTMQDIFIRWKRMSGYEACWLPGTDHAGIATQMMVEKDLAKEGKTRQQVGREEFLKRLWDWKEVNGGKIIEAFKVMGFSCDWNRLAFTMDEDLSEAVRKIFVDLFEGGYIYRGERLVNWDPVLKTALSDDEVENKEVNGHIWHLRYPIKGEAGHLTVATTRPETMLGDTALAVHPDDERYKHLIGKSVIVPLVEREIPIVGDEYVKSEFGTGCVKVTPAHDPNDFEIGKRHNLPFIDIMNDDATLNDNVPASYRGLDRFVARKQLIKELKSLDLFEEEKAYKNTVPHSERSKAVIEPRLSKQWFVKMTDLAKPALDAAKSGELKFHPDLWKKTYFNWLENIQDWCISRQLWWGHRIPIWECSDCGEYTTGMQDPSACGKCGSSQIKQDEDVLDTWFSSWLWPLSPFGWPDDSADLKHFYPTDVLVTAPEIIFLWVARMVMVGLHTKGEIPFKHVYLTATVCDKQGKKFSKTLGNGIDPFELIETHGTDATRFTAVHLAPLGARIKMAKEDFDMGARFVNKLWNAARFLLKQLPKGFSPSALSELNLGRADQWLIDEFSQVAKRVDQNLENFRLNDAVDQVYHFIWGSFCDWGIEAAKASLEDEASKQKSLSVLIYALDGALRLASPVMPFITEEIWQKLPNHPDWDRPKSLVVASFPKGEIRYGEQADQWRRVQEVISAIRSVRSQSAIAPKQRLKATIKTSREWSEVFEAEKGEISRLAKLESCIVATGEVATAKSLVAVGRDFEVHIEAEGLIDIEAEKKRIESEVSRIEKIVSGISKKLGNKSFVDRAPQEIVQQNREQLANLDSQLTSLRKNLEGLA